MMRNPRRCSPYGTEPPALRGSREAPTTAIVVERSRICRGDLFTRLCTTACYGDGIPRVCAQTRGIWLRDLDVRLRGRRERDPQHVLHPAGQVERHRLAHALRHVVQVLLVAPGEDD